MRRALIVVPLLWLSLLVVGASSVSAMSLKIAPLRYQTTLQKGEKQKGFVDISNPSAETITVGFEVQAFRQIDNDGGVEFYDDKDVAAGVQLDLRSASLGPTEVLRLYFLLDSTKLPSGEVYAAIMARTIPQARAGTEESVRVGTILEITNDRPSTHRASVESFTAPLFQVGERISARFVIANDDRAHPSTGFRPAVTFDVKPYSSTRTEGPLVFGGRSRTVDYSLPGNYFGIVWLQAGVGDSSKGSLAFVMTGYWRWLGPMLIVALFSTLFAIHYTRKTKR